MSPSNRKAHAPAALLRVLLPALAILVSPACGPAAGDRPDSSEASQKASGEGFVILTEAPDPEAEFDPDALPERPYYHDFGHVPDGEVAAHVFRLENRDPGPIAILKIKPGCGCTLSRVRTTNADGEVIRGAPIAVDGRALLVVQPGRIAEVELQIDTRLMSTKNIDKTLSTLVTTDSPNTYYLTLETHIFAEKPFDIVPNGIRFGHVPLGGEAVGTNDVVLAPGFDLELGDLKFEPKGIRTEVSHIEDSRRPLWRVTVTFTPEADGGLGRWTGKLLFATHHPDGSPGRPLELPLQADRSADILPDPTRLVFVAKEDQSAGEVTLSTLLAGHIFAVRELHFEDPRFESLFELSFSASGTQRNGRSSSWVIGMRVRDASAVTDIQRGTILALLDDPQHESVEITFVVHPAP